MSTPLHLRRASRVAEWHGVSGTVVNDGARARQAHWFDSNTSAEVKYPYRLTGLSLALEMRWSNSIGSSHPELVTSACDDWRLPESDEICLNPSSAPHAIHVELKVRQLPSNGLRGALWSAISPQQAFTEVFGVRLRLGGGGELLGGDGSQWNSADPASRLVQCATITIDAFSFS